MSHPELSTGVTFEAGAAQHRQGRIPRILIVGYRPAAAQVARATRSGPFQCVSAQPAQPGVDVPWRSHHRLIMLRTEAGRHAPVRPADDARAAATTRRYDAAVRAARNVAAWAACVSSAPTSKH
jgi:hypothetical protein